MIKCQGHQDRVGKEGGDNGNLSIEKKVWISFPREEGS